MVPCCPRAADARKMPWLPRGNHARAHGHIAPRQCDCDARMGHTDAWTRNISHKWTHPIVVLLAGQPWVSEDVPWWWVTAAGVSGGRPPPGSGLMARLPARLPPGFYRAGAPGVCRVTSCGLPMLAAGGPGPQLSLGARGREPRPLTPCTPRLRASRGERSRQVHGLGPGGRYEAGPQVLQGPAPALCGPRRPFPSPKPALGRRGTLASCARCVLCPMSLSEELHGGGGGMSWRGRRSVYPHSCSRRMGRTHVGGHACPGAGGSCCHWEGCRAPRSTSPRIAVAFGLCHLVHSLFCCR